MLRKFAVTCVLTAALVPATAGSAAAGSYDWLLAPSTKCANQTNPRLSWDQQEAVMLCMHNYARARARVAPLRGNSLLARSSDGKTADLISCGFSHTACGRPFDYWFRRVGYLSCPTYGIAENIAWGTGSLGTVRAIMRAWLNSEGHRQNLLNPAYRDAGFGLRKGSISGHKGASVWTGHFGYRRGC